MCRFQAQARLILSLFTILIAGMVSASAAVYADAIDGQVFHYRDAIGLESDTVVCLNDGRWAPIEMKLGAKAIEEAAEHFLELKAKVDIKKMNEPSFLMILTGGQFAYRRKDGVLVVPIGSLKD